MNNFFKHILFVLLTNCCSISMFAQQSQDSLHGTIISSSEEWTKAASNAFDGDAKTSCISTSSSNAWVGLDLGEKHVITRVKWIAARDSQKSTQLALFEGSNREDFMDAIPLAIITSTGDGEKDVNVSRGFRYVRYVSPNSAKCRVAEVQFYGTKGEGDDSHFYQLTNLPTVVVHVEDAKEPEDKITNLTAFCNVIYGKETKIISEDCTFRLRGNYSRNSLAKKPYRVKFLSKQKMPDAPGKAKKWTLIPSHGDKTLMRNILSFDFSKRMEMPYTPYCRPVDVIVNGEYKGCYQLCDQLTISKDRVNIKEMTENDISNEELTGGYFFQVDANSGTDDVRIYSNNIGQYLTFHSPDEDVIQQVQIDYLLSQFDDMTKRSGSKFTNFENLLDKDTFLKHFIINEFIGNTDTYWETYFYKDRGDVHIYTGPVWDCDLTFDNDRRTHEYLNNQTSTGWTFQNGGSTTGKMKAFVNSVIDNNSYSQRMKELWAHARAGEVQEDLLMALVDKKVALLDSSQQLNFIRWPILSKKVHENYQALGDYYKEVDVVKDYIPRRLSWFDNMLLTATDTQNIHVSNAEWSTIYFPYAFAAPDGLTIYSVEEDADNNQLQFNEVQITEPNKPYLIMAKEGDYNVTAYWVDTIDGNNNGALTGSSIGTNVPINSYVLQVQDGKARFIKVHSSNNTVNPQEAYLTLSDDCLLVKLESFDLSTATSIDCVQQSHNIARVYTMSGMLIMTTDIVSTEAIRNQFGSGVYIIKRGGKVEKIIL